ncbi:Uncharacterised protein [Candidatus Bilamarchaeum dharawalense]|uniref:Uncharacterized protein n=1 Tax=Candidatus Bilamarchaeum dharawalense TaxID=2885759 RepID=A0A5E4LMT6_9ARCH|nr:Uncharacterised protein [Candidatus Bilamarchaeum dharawalense]
MKLKAIKFYKVEAEHVKEDAFTNVAVNLNIQDAKVAGSDFRTDFIFSVMYDPYVAHIKFNGYVLIEGTSTEINQLATVWKKDKLIPRELGEQLINAVTFQAQCNGVLVAKALSMTPPLLSPKIQIKLETPKKK